MDIMFIGLVGNPSQGCPVCGDYHCGGCDMGEEEEKEPETCLECKYYQGDLQCEKEGDLEPMIDEGFDLRWIAGDCGEKSSLYA